MKNYEHRTVFLNEAINSLNINPNGIYIDGTFGYGGHSRLILSKLSKKGRLLAIDRDPQVAAIANNINDSRFFFMHGQFSLLSHYVAEFGLTGKIDGILLDLGISSMQLDDPRRGFSFMHDGPLDMRMDPTNGQSVAEWLFHAKENDIAWVIKTFGEERFSKQIARAIAKRNYIKSPLIRTKELVEVIIKVIPRKDKHKHPATRTFQAMRIWINNELEEIKLFLRNALNILNYSGRLSVISFHSLEDRIVKQFMREYDYSKRSSEDLIIMKTQLNCKSKNHKLRILNKLISNKKEIMKNPRSRSAVLRTAEKIKYD